jgi:hypothetical protein
MRKRYEKPFRSSNRLPVQSSERLSPLELRFGVGGQRSITSQLLQAHGNLRSSHVTSGLVRASAGGSYAQF